MKFLIIFLLFLYQKNCLSVQTSLLKESNEKEEEKLQKIEFNKNFTQYEVFFPSYSFIL